MHRITLFMLHFCVSLVASPNSYYSFQMWQRRKDHSVRERGLVSEWRASHGEQRLGPSLLVCGTQKPPLLA